MMPRTPLLTPPVARARSARSGRWAQRGAALVETAVLLPFFVIVLAGLVYLGRKKLAEHDALATVRRCAWAFSKGACRTPPPRCPPELFEPERAPADQELIGSVNEARAAAGASTGEGGFAGAVRRRVDGLVELVLGESVRVEQRLEVAVPPPLPGSTRIASARYYLPCNLAPTSPGRIAGELWDALRGAP